MTSDDDINFKLNDDNNSDLLVTDFKGKTEAAQEAVVRIVSGLMASDRPRDMPDRVFTAMNKWL